MPNMFGRMSLLLHVQLMSSDKDSSPFRQLLCNREDQRI